jgi:hypothetical protein
VTPEIAKKLKFGGKLHKKIAEALQTRLRMSHQRFSNRYSQMAKNEEMFQAYIPTREVDRLRKVNRDTYGVPEYSTIELPYGYSVVMTMHTYYTSVFCARNPIFQLMGRHGESEQKVQAMETLLSYQMSVGANVLPLFIWLLDPGKYGYSVLGQFWDKETVRVRRIIKKAPEFFGTPIPDTDPVTETVVEETIGYEGNRFYNVRPQDAYPDPRVALVHFQKGEFFGRYTEVPWNEIYVGSREDQGNFRYFNFDELKRQRDKKDHEQGGGIPTRDLGSDRVTDLPGTGLGGYDIPVGFIKGHEVYLKLNPADWGLGEEKFQEIWFFNITSNGVIFGAGPLEDLSGKFPFDILTDEIDGYSVFPKSTLERVKPLNDVMTWLVNTHFYNVRAALNNQFLIDPSRVVMKDVENPEPGKHIRLKPNAYGQDVRTIMQQLQVADMTRGHVADLNLVMEMVQRMVPANDSLMGVQQGGSNRTTATQTRTSTHFSTSRLKTQCEWWSAMGFSQLSQKVVQRTQQNYDQAKQFRLVGDLAQFSTEFIEVNPEMIAGFFDYEPVDGTLPIDRFAQANLWQMILGQMQKHPQILMEYDIAKIFAWVAQLGGIKNLAQFRLTQEQKLQQMLQAGNVVPITEANKQITGKGSPPVPKQRGNPQEPRQLPSVGPTG